MNRILIAAAIALAASSAFAAGDIGEAPPFVPSLTRAQVQSELQQYQQSGVNPWAQDFNPLASFRSSRTRDEVTAEFLRSREETAALGSEDSGSAWLTAHARSTAAAPVLAGEPVNAQ